jgi:hypothetical protein
VRIDFGSRFDLGFRTAFEDGLDIGVGVDMDVASDIRCASSVSMTILDFVPVVEAEGQSSKCGDEKLIGLAFAETLLSKVNAGLNS